MAETARARRSETKAERGHNVEPSVSDTNALQGAFSLRAPLRPDLDVGRCGRSPEHTILIFASLRVHNIRVAFRYKAEVLWQAGRQALEAAHGEQLAGGLKPPDLNLV